MATNSPLLRVPLPVTGDTDQVPADLLTQTANAETYWIGRFSGSAERTTYLTAASLGTGIRGMLSWVDSPGRYETHNGTTWVALIASTFETDATAVYGTNWDGVTPTRTIARRAGATVGASGLFAVGFPTAFPNGLLNIQVSMGDNTTGVLTVVTVNSLGRLNQFQGQALTAVGTVVASGTNITVNYLATGW
jgi:hypothetical protein